MVQIRALCFPALEWPKVSASNVSLNLKAKASVTSIPILITKVKTCALAFVTAFEP